MQKNINSRLEEREGETERDRESTAERTLECLPLNNSPGLPTPLSLSLLQLPQCVECCQKGMGLSRENWSLSEEAIRREELREKSE